MGTAIETISLNDKISKVKGVGDKVAEKFLRLGVENIKDLAFYWPKRVIDLSDPKPFNQLKIGEKAVVCGRLRDIKMEMRHGSRQKHTTANLYNEEGLDIPITWFNQGYLASTLRHNERVLIYGDVRWDFKKKKKTFWNPKIEKNEGILTIYPETKGLNSKFISKIFQNIELDKKDFPDIFNSQNLNLPEFYEAIEQIHNPRSAASWHLAQKRLKLNELIFLFYFLKKKDREEQKINSYNLKAPQEILKNFVDSLPFKLTNGQKLAAWSIIKSFEANYPIHQLLLGDVGTGKTVVAALAAIPALTINKKVLWLAPTQVLASQLHSRLSELLEPLGIKPELATSKTKPNLKEQFFVGTHSLINAEFNQEDLGLIIIDEQHRFGVKQRESLGQAKNGFAPHTLTMTATPIPRSLAMSIWGERKLAVLTDRPSAQQPIKTIICRQRDKIKTKLEEQIKSGRQAFVVAPRIDGVETDDENLSRLSLEDLQKIYKKMLPEAKIAIYHGKQKPDEQAEIMEKFLKGETDILIATSIIEVGIDVPNATVVVIEDAHWFGLAQLHQIRGRVGRGKHPGTCFIVSKGEDEEIAERLKYFASINDGFKLAEMDLKLRGPGDLLGTKQSGIPPLKLANFFDDELITIAKNISENILDNPPESLSQFLRLYE